MLQTSAPPITRRDYQAMPAGPPYYQVIEGNLVMSPSPNTFHQIIIGRIHQLIATHLEKHAIGEVFIAPLDVFLGDMNVFQSDVFFVSKSRYNIIAEHGIEGAPDLIIEALSPSTARYDKGSKREVYGKFGVKELWLVDADTRTIQVFLPSKNSETPVATYGDKATFESTVLPSLSIKTAAIFKTPPRK